MSAKQVKSLNEFVVSFLEQNGCDDSVSESWSSDDNQKEFTKVVTKSLTKSERKKKDPAAPKRSKSAYMFFCEEMRSKVKEENPDMKATEITSELGLRWKELKEKGQKAVDKYNKLAEQDKHRYACEKSEYVPSPEVETTGRRKRTKKDPAAPKRAKSAYLFFCEEMRPVVKAENPSMKATELTAEIGNRWNVLKSEDPESLEKFNRLAEQDKERYAREVAEHQGGSQPEQPEKQKRTRAKKTDKEEESKPVKATKATTKSKKAESDDEQVEEEEKQVKKGKAAAVKTASSKTTSAKTTKSKAR